MKFHGQQLLSPGKPRTRRRNTASKIAPLVALIVLLAIPLYHPSFGGYAGKLSLPHPQQSLLHDSIISTTTSRSDENVNNRRSGLGGIKTLPEGRNAKVAGKLLLQKAQDEECDLFSGEWVPNHDAPYCTNATCNAIQEHQNCMKYGRPDSEFLKWRWKPDGCGLPIFASRQFLQLVKGKSLALVGDSVARNHMQSLICLLSNVAYPTDFSAPTDQNMRYVYWDYDFNISMFWTPYLVKTAKLDTDSGQQRPFDIYLDEYDEHWTSKIALFDYVVISAGHWFFRPTYFYVKRSLSSCLYCPDSNVRHQGAAFGYRRAFRTALRAINNAANFKDVAFLRTFAPSHFEGGVWDHGGDCRWTRPYRRDQVALQDFVLEMYTVQLEELRLARKEAGGTGRKFRLFDATKPMLLRPDGHPSKYGHPQGANLSMANDCVHWCLPGPIDAWNDFLQELIKRETQYRSNNGLLDIF